MGVFLLLLLFTGVVLTVSYSANSPAAKHLITAESAHKKSFNSINRNEIHYVDGRRSVGWEAYYERHSHCDSDALKRFPPPHYDWNTLPALLSRRVEEYIVPSYGDLETHEEHIVFQRVFALYQRGRALEKEQDYTTALDCYLLILLSVVPLGDSYYVRPAILLERYKQYESALVICKMRKRFLRRDAGAFPDELKAQWKKREDRLKRKQNALQSP